AYVSDGESPDNVNGVVWQIDIDPTSPTYNKAVQTVTVGPAPDGLRGLAVNANDERVFVAAPHREVNAFIRDEAQASLPENIIVINVDPQTGHMEEMPGRQIEVGGLFRTGDMEPFAVTATKDPNIITFTDRRSDAFGLGVIHNALA